MLQLASRPEGRPCRWFFDPVPPQSAAYLWPPAEPCPLEALPADEDVLVLEDAAAVEEETLLAAVDMVPEYPLEVCGIPP
jgi:hypothetical protein